MVKNFPQTKNRSKNVFLVKKFSQNFQLFSILKSIFGFLKPCKVTFYFKNEKSPCHAMVLRFCTLRWISGTEFITSLISYPLLTYLGTGGGGSSDAIGFRLPIALTGIAMNNSNCKIFRGFLNIFFFETRKIDQFSISIFECAYGNSTTHNDLLNISRHNII